MFALFPSTTVYRGGTGARIYHAMSVLSRCIYRCVALS